MVDTDARVERVLAEYDARAAAESRLFAAGWDLDDRRDQLLLRIGPDTGRLVNILAKGAGARSILELGTSFGYSTVWLAEAARETGGRVITLDLARHKQDYARTMLDRAGLADQVDWRTGDALELLKELDGPFDFVLIDLWKDLYVPCFELIAPKLAPRAILVADNMLRPEYARADAEAYRARVRRHRDMESVLLEVGSGICVSRYAPPRRT
ncbi:MAG: class I SAM-dependent methyltransferase [Steroidobacteraceae bacterium]